MGNFFNFVIHFIVIKSVISRSVTEEPTFFLKSISFDQPQNQVNINFNSGRHLTSDDDLNLKSHSIAFKPLKHNFPSLNLSKLLKESLRIVRLKRLTLTYDESKSQPFKFQNVPKNHLIKRRSLSESNYKEVYDQLSGRNKFTKKIQKRSFPSIINYFMSYLQNLMTSEDEPTTERSLTDKLKEISLANKREVLNEGDKKNVIVVPVEDEELVKDLSKEIKTEDSDAAVIQVGNEIPKGKKEFMFIQELPGTSNPDEVDDFLKQVRHQQVELYNSIEAKREGLNDDEDGDEDSEKDV